jgi:hypothetical protein
MANEDLVRTAIAQQRDAALNALAFAHAEITELKARIEELQAQIRGERPRDEQYE